MRNFLGATLLLICLQACSKTEVKDGNKFVNEREEVVKQIQDGAIHPDETGAVALPKELKDCTPTGKVYAIQSATEGLHVLFDLAENPDGKEFNGLLYAENPIPLDTKKLQVGSFQLNVRLQNNVHWYIVDNRPR